MIKCQAIFSISSQNNEWFIYNKILKLGTDILVGGAFGRDAKGFRKVRGTQPDSLSQIQ